MRSFTKIRYIYRHYNITMVIQVKSREQLDRVFTQLHKRSDIIEVYRGST